MTMSGVIQIKYWKWFALSENNFPTIDKIKKDTKLVSFFI